MKCPYCGKYKAKEVNREENFNFSDANIDIVLSCPDCGRESVLNMEKVGYSTTNDDYLEECD
jgi:ssDNA-binding Zn-finger/Zn-ribbon topoisomerase 1